MIFLVKTIFSFFIVFFISQNIIAQEVEGTSSYERSTSQVRKVYFTSLEKNSPLYNGKVYHHLVRLNNNHHPFFLNNQSNKGEIIFNGLRFSNIQIQYDLYQDQLLIENENNTAKLILQAHLVDSFYINKHFFINQKDNSNGIQKGYYEVLFKNEEGTLIVKRKKQLKENITTIKIERVMENNDKFFLKKDSIYLPVNTKKTLLNLLKSTHNQNLTFLKKNKLSFKDNKEYAIVELVKFHYLNK